MCSLLSESNWVVNIQAVERFAQPGITQNEILGRIEREVDELLSVIAKRYKFHKRKQRPGESIAEYMVQIEKLSKYCQFGAFLEEALRDRFVCGLNTQNKKIQEKLITETDLTFKRACGRAVQLEMSEKDVWEMHRPHSFGAEVDSVNKISCSRRSSANFAVTKSEQEKNKKPEQVKLCFRCGQKHSPATCKVKDVKCFGCGPLGHILKVCKRRPRETHQIC